MRFFDNFPRFYASSHTSPYPDRLEARYQAAIKEIRVELSGARVLDVASHDGRWSFASLMNDAIHVTGIEPRPELVDEAADNMRAYGINEDRYEFICGDVFDVLGDCVYDVVLCLGFFYHTLRHAELFARLAACSPRILVIDTEVVPRAITSRVAQSPDGCVGDARGVFDNPCIIQVLSESVGLQQMACADRLSRRGQALVGRPSVGTVKLLANHFGYQADNFDWNDYLVSHPTSADSLVDYSERWRETFYCRPR